MSKIKKIFIVIGVAVILCVASFFTGLCISANSNAQRITDLEQQRDEQIVNYRQLLNSTATGNREMARYLETTRDLNKQLVDGLTRSRETTDTNIERLRSAIDDSRRINEIIESAKPQD